MPVAFEGLDGLTLDACQDRWFGFLTVTAAPGITRVVYNVLRDGAVRAYDEFSFAAR